MKNFEKPQTKLTNLDIIAGPAREDFHKFIPLYREIPEQFRNEHAWSNKLFSDWFYHGLLTTATLVTKEGISKSDAVNHLKSIMVLMDISYEQKTAAFAYLADLWFNSNSTWQPNKR